MKFLAVYRAGFYVMLTFATLVLSIDATDINRIAMLYPVAVAVSGVLAATTVDRNPRLGLSRGLANLFALGSVSLTYLEYKYDESLLLLALAHWLVYLQLVKMFLPKTVEDDWFLFLNGLVQVLVGGVMSQSDQVGAALFCWAIAALWVLGLFTLHREALRAKPTPGTIVTPANDPAEPYPGLIDWPFVFSTLKVAAVTLLLGGVIFLVMPRRTTMGSSLRGDTIGRHLTGFDDEVPLGQIGEILENDSVVMTVELYDQDDKKIVPDEELYWRGVTMSRYERQRWRRERLQPGSFSLYLPGRPKEAKLIRQDIKLEPNDNAFLFSLRPALDGVASNKRFQPEFNEVDGSLYRTDTRPASIDYQVYSSADPDQPQPGELYPLARRAQELVTVDPRIKARLGPIAERLVADIPPDQVLQRARKLEEYLRDSGEFSYSLQMEIEDSDLDPVVDFVVNRKRGHCAYFASALALMLRSINIPSRLVNGFKGGDWNDLSGSLNVRQKHAHSWVEVLVGRTPGRLREGLPIWIRLDPTPAGARVETLSQIGGMPQNVRALSDFIRYVWVFYIVGFNAERQQRFLYQPIRALFEEAKRGFEIMRNAISRAADWVFQFNGYASLISIRGAVLVMILLLILLALLVVGRIVFRWISRAVGLRRPESVDVRPGVLIYRRLIELLSKVGFDRASAETPREFAGRASVFLSSGDPAEEPVSNVPPSVVEAYYRIRFGSRDLSREELGELERRLDSLDRKLRASSARG